MTLLRAVVLIAACGSSLVMASEQEALASLSVRGEAVVKVPADQVKFSVAIETIAKTAEKALKENSQLMAKVRAGLEREGLSKTEVKTNNFSVIPQWLPRPRQSNSNWKPKIVSYMVRNQLRIESSQLEKVGVWMQRATEAGANSIGQVQFGLQDADTHRSEAIALAVKKARVYAEAAANAAGVRIQGVASIQVDGASVQPVYAARKERMVMALSDAASAPPEITPGNIEVRSNVTLSYLISQ